MLGTVEGVTFAPVLQNVYAGYSKNASSSGFIVKLIVALSGLQGPIGLSEFRVNVTFPLLISAADGV